MTRTCDTLSVHHSRSGGHPPEGVTLSPEMFCDRFVLYGVLTRSLQFNPQAADACQTVPVFFDSRIVGHGREHEPK